LSLSAGLLGKRPLLDEGLDDLDDGLLIVGRELLDFP